MNKRGSFVGAEYNALSDGLVRLISGAGNRDQVCTSSSALVNIEPSFNERSTNHRPALVRSRHLQKNLQRTMQGGWINQNSTPQHFLEPS